MRGADIKRAYEAIVIGASAGGLTAIMTVIKELSETFPLPILVAKHIAAADGGGAAKVLNKVTPMPVFEAMDKQPINPGSVYLAPANYHMLTENKALVCLNCDERVCHARPSIDVLFRSAASVFGDRLIAIILTGANHDGAEGVRAVKRLGGLTIAQSPASAESVVMPNAAIATGSVDRVLPLDEISAFINELTTN
ncbi:chemotaxis protein CheB [Candidatus Sororendozoicomonas aggregata]|uniref:chemotaxis protein CheB n=1 Tax=Candidatus Sororendozoicomonas aggregata TaxID=3073239 RepID=UPI002ED1EF74